MSSPALIVSSAALIVPLPAYRFHNKLAPNVPNNILGNLPFCSFASFSIVSLTLFINKPHYLRDLIIFMISFIFSLEDINDTCFAKSEGRATDPSILL